MSGAKTFVFGVLVAVMGSATQAQPLYQTFAICTGRLMAATEHSWLMQSDLSDLRENQRRQFEDLLDVTQPANMSDHVLALRVEARASHKMILQRAQFASNKREKDWAQRQASAALIQCTGMLPSS